jgi:hypothetical protein
VRIEILSSSWTRSEKAITSAKRTRVHDHIDHCLEASAGPATRKQRAQIREFKEMTRYL